MYVVYLSVSVVSIPVLGKFFHKVILSLYFLGKVLYSLQNSTDCILCDIISV